MQTKHHAEASPLALLLAWMAHRLSAHMKAIRPRYTAEQSAAAVALSGNPTGT